MKEDLDHVRILQKAAQDLKKDTSLVSVNDKRKIKKRIFNEIEEGANNTQQMPLARNKSFQRKRHTGTFYRTTQFWWKAAAVILVTVTAAIGAYYYNSLNSVTTSTKQTEWITQTVPNGQKVSFYFSDGTFIKLNSGSTLRYPKHFAGKYREVYLKGEAFFSVAENELKPFLVHSGGVITRDLGTKFNINAYPDQNNVQVAVAEGKVAVSVNDTNSTKATHPQKVVLTKNQWVGYHEDTSILHKEKANIGNMIAWKDHVLVFDNKTLSQVSRMLERWYGVKVKIKGHDLKNVVFKGKYDAKSLEKVLDSIQFILGIHYTMHDSVVTISASGQTQR